MSLEPGSVEKSVECADDALSACLEQVRRGDEAAARALVQRVSPLVMKIIRSHLPRRESEDDLAQKVLIKMFTKLSQYSAKVPFEHWVSRIAVNTCLNQIRSESSRPELRWSDLSEEQGTLVATLTEQEGEIDPSLHLASKDLVETLLAPLPPADRLLVNLLYLQGQSLREIQALTGWNLPLIKIRAFRARARLRKRYTQLLQESAHE